MCKEICQTCKQLKHDTAFPIKWIKLDTTICYDCMYPDRWDEVRKEFKKFLEKINKYGMKHT